MEEIIALLNSINNLLTAIVIFLGIGTGLLLGIFGGKFISFYINNDN